MFLLTVLGIIAVLLVLSGIVGVLVTFRKYRERVEQNRTRALMEMMKIAQERTGEKED